jgi:Zn-dependent protease
MSLQYVDVAFEIIVFLFAISVHESAHAWTASRHGDPTARMLGRVSLNPLRHIDPMGTVFLPLLAIIMHFPMFGWAKPTPVDPRNFKNPVRDDILTAIAGPISNFLIASAATVGMAFIALSSPLGHDLVRVVPQVPASYLDQLAQQTGSPLLPLTRLLYNALEINVLLGVFNLIPVPPLDGSHVLRHFLSEPVRRAYDMFGMLALFLLVFAGGRFLSMLFYPVLNLFTSLLTRI